MWGCREPGWPPVGLHLAACPLLVFARLFLLVFGCFLLLLALLAGIPLYGSHIFFVFTSLARTVDLPAVWPKDKIALSVRPPPTELVNGCTWIVERGPGGRESQHQLDPPDSEAQR